MANLEETSSQATARTSASPRGSLGGATLMAVLSAVEPCADTRPGAVGLGPGPVRFFVPPLSTAAPPGVDKELPISYLPPPRPA